MQTHDALLLASATAMGLVGALGAVLMLLLCKRQRLEAAERRLLLAMAASAGQGLVLCRSLGILSIRVGGSSMKPPFDPVLSALDRLCVMHLAAQSPQRDPDRELYRLTAKGERAARRVAASFTDKKPVRRLAESIMHLAVGA